MLRLIKALPAVKDFSLHLFIGDSENVIKKKLKELTDVFGEEIETLDLTKSNKPVSYLLTKVSQSEPGRIMVVNGLGKCVYPAENEIDLEFLPVLNTQLFELRKISRRVVLVIPIHLYELIQKDAPDIWEWRSGLYLFEERDEDRYETAAYLCDHFLGSLHSETYLQKQTLHQLYKTLKYEYTAETHDKSVLLEHALLGKIGCLLYKLGNYRQAFDYFRKQLDFCEIIGDEKLFPPVHNNIGMVYAALSNYDEALEYLQRAWKLGETTLRGDNHPNKSIMLSNIGEVHQYLGSLQDAFLNCRQALRMSEKRLGMRHPNLVPIINKYARVLREQKQYDDALDQYRRALHIVEKQFDIDHPYLAVVLQNIGMTYFSQEKYDVARRYMYRTVEITERAMGAEHPYFGLLMNNIGLTHYHSDHEDWALKYFTWALEIRKNSVGSQDLLIGNISANIAKVLYSQEKYDEAKTYLREAHDIYRLKLPEEHPELASIKQWILMVTEAQFAAKKEARIQQNNEA